mgnify:CR=1 FL=1
MHRLLPLLLVLFAAPAHADDVHAGTRVRIGTASASVVGRLTEKHPDTVVVVAQDGRRFDVPAHAITNLEVSDGMRSQEVRYGFYGFLVGLGVGGVATLALGRGGDEGDYFLEYTLAPPALAGIVVGAVIGHFIEREEWSVIDARGLRVAPSVNHDGVSLVLGASF